MSDAQAHTASCHLQLYFDHDHYDDGDGDGGDDGGDDGRDDGDDDDSDDCDHMKKIRKSKFPKTVKKPLKIKELT